MNFGEINKQIQADIPSLTQKMEVYRAINRVIRDINAKFPGELKTVTGLTNETGTLTAAADFTWTDADRTLQMPDNCKEIHKVFINGVELERRGLEFAKDSDNSDENIFAVVDRNTIYLPADLAGTADDEVEIKMNQGFAVLTATANATELSVPDQLTEVVMNGVRSYLFAKPAYRDETEFKIATERYQEDLKAVSELENNRLPGAHYERKYTY